MTLTRSLISTPIRRGQVKVEEPESPLVLPSRERILVYGREGTSKTEGWLSVAEMWPDAQFFVLDTDDSVARMLETDHPDLKNVHYKVAQNWADFDKGVDDYLLEIRKLVSLMKSPTKEQLPWLVIDFADTTWDMVQSHYVEQVFHTGIDEYFMKARAANRNAAKLQPLEGWTDWQVINKIFQSTWNNITKGGAPCHLYLTAKAVDSDGKDLELKSLYKNLKKMPGGEKRMGGRVHTVLMTSVDQDGWYLSSAKDRGRTLLMNQKVATFAISYLIKVAGWRP